MKMEDHFYHCVYVTRLWNLVTFSICHAHALTYAECPKLMAMTDYCFYNQIKELTI